MMEFTMSRVLMALCGLMIMAVSLGPFSSIYDQRLDQAGMNTVDDVADLFNMISSKGENVSYLIHGYDLLPSPDYYLKIKGYSISLCHENGNYTAFTNLKIDNIDEITISFDDTLLMSVQHEGEFQIYRLVKVSDTLTNASINALASLASL